MGLLLFITYPIAEIYSIIFVTSKLGFWPTFYTLILISALGVMLAKMQGRNIIQSLQHTFHGELSQGVDSLHSTLKLLGCILLIIPGFISDVIGLTFILPIFRHLWVLYFAKVLLKKASSGAKLFQFINLGPMGGGFSYTRTYDNKSTHFNQDKNNNIRDAEVIDVTPKEIEVKKKEE